MKKIKSYGGIKMETITFTKTNAGFGYKIVVDGTWFYVNRKYLQEVLNNERKSCVFNTIK